MQFRLEGGAEAIANIKAIAEAVDPRNLREDGLVALEPIAEEARSLAPVDQGDLRDSIQVVTFDDGSVGVEIGDWKGHFFEFGTVNMRATPMLLPAVDRHDSLALRAFGERVGVRIERAA